MRTWDVTTLDLDPRRPEILASGDAARVIALALPAGERLQEHEVHEQALLVVLAGQLEVTAGDESAIGAAGSAFAFEAHERHEVRAVEDARMLLMLAPWPGDGHPGAMSLDDKASARERARGRA